MNKKLIKTILGILLLLLTSIPLFAFDEDPLWEEKTNSQIKYQTDLATLLLKEMPEAEELILIQRDMQIVMIKIRSEEYYYLLQNHPDQIVTNQGILRWINYEWTEENEKELLNSNEQYKNLQKEREDLIEKNQKQQQWPIVHEKFSKIKETEEYKKIDEGLTKSFSAIEEKLKTR